MNKRIKEIREALGLTQEEFGNRISIKRAFASMLESGVRDVNERIVKLICSEFNVDEVWLKTGSGDMFVNNDDSLINEMASRYRLNDVCKSILKVFVELNEFEQAVIATTFEKISNEIKVISEVADQVIEDSENQSSNTRNKRNKSSNSVDKTINKGK